MPLIEWRDAFRTGFAQVDHEHRELIGLLNRLHARMVKHDARAVGHFLAELHDAIASHFALEEHVMRDTGYAGFLRHKQDHERLLDELRDLMEAQHQAPHAQLPDHLARCLEDWFMQHFHKEDAKLHCTGSAMP